MQRRVHIDRVPEHDDVDHQTEGAELVFLAFAIALPQLSALAMEHHAGELMAPLAAIASLPRRLPPLWVVSGRSPSRTQTAR